MADTAAEAPVKKPKSKKLLVIIIAAVVLLGAIAGGGLFLLNRSKHAAEDEGEDKPAAEAPKAPPTFLPMDNMVVNLADPGGDRFAQIGITLELQDKKTEDRVKAYLPSIRSNVLMLVSQRTAEELLRREGKEKLASDILAEVSRPLGITVKPPVERKDKGERDEEERPRKRSEPNPVLAVRFSSFIIQ